MGQCRTLGLCEDDYAIEGIHETVTFGAAGVGISQGVLDIVAEGLLTPDQGTLVWVSLWIDAAAMDETNIKNAAREAVAAATREAVLGRSAEDRAQLVKDRETIRHPFYSGAWKKGSTQRWR